MYNIYNINKYYKNIVHRNYKPKNVIILKDVNLYVIIFSIHISMKTAYFNYYEINK